MNKKLSLLFVFALMLFQISAYAASEDVYLNTTDSEEFTIWDEDNTTSFFTFEGENDGQFGIGTVDPSAPIHIDTDQNHDTPIMILDNSGGTSGDITRFYVSSVASPEGNIVGDIGDVVIGTTAGEMFVKQADDGLNTGWEEVLTAASGGSLQGAYDAGQVILTDDAGGDIEFDLADTTTDASFVIDLQGTATGDATGDLLIQDNGSTFAAFNESGEIDFSAATSLEIPNAADPTLDALGEIAVDTTDNTLTMHDGTAERVIAHDTYQFTATIETDGDWEGEVVPIWQAPKDMAITVTQVDAAVLGTTTPTIDFNIEKRSLGSLGSVGTDILTGEPEADADGVSPTISTAAVSAQDHLVFTTGNTGSVEGGTVNAFTVTVYYRKDVE